MKHNRDLARQQLLGFCELLKRGQIAFDEKALVKEIQKYLHEPTTRERWVKMLGDKADVQD